MTVSIVKETPPESRVALTPEAVNQLSGLGLGISVEHLAGEASWFSNRQYETSGARLVNRTTLLSGKICLLSVNPISPEELQAVEPGSVWIGNLNPFANKELIDFLNERQITSFSLELLPRTTLAQSMDVLSSMATISGYKAVLEAANLLPKFFPMFMTAAGTIKPARVLILGAGVAGLQAVATARRLGAVVEVFDVRTAVKEEVQSLGARFIEVEGALEDSAAGGYAVEQSADFQNRQMNLIQQHAVKSDVIICTAQIPGRKAPLLVTADTIESMQPGSVIIDLAASSGGNCELTINRELRQHKGIAIAGRSEYPADMPIDASKMYSNNMMNFLRLLLSGNNEIVVDMGHEIVGQTCLTHEGKLINKKLAEYFANL